MPITENLNKEYECVNSCGIPCIKRYIQESLSTQSWVGYTVLYLLLVILSTGFWVANGALGGLIGNAILNDEKYSLYDDVLVMVIGTSIYGGGMNFFLSFYLYIQPYYHYVYHINTENIDKPETIECWNWGFYKYICFIYSVFVVIIFIPVCGIIGAMTGASILDISREDSREDSGHYALVGFLGSTIIACFYFVLFIIMRIIHVNYYVNHTRVQDDKRVEDNEVSNKSTLNLV